MKIVLKIILILIGFVGFQSTQAQNNRLNTHNAIGWYNYFGTYKLSNQFGIHTEYQWRREQWIRNWQQSLLRVGLNYHLNPRVLCRVGYAWVETYPYDEIPLNAMGKEFTEHRIYEMMQLAHREGRIDLSHRFMLEQRFVGKYSSAALRSEDQFPLLHRFRYMCRVQSSLLSNKSRNTALYLALYDEIFIGFGKNVNANVFDQNRIGVLMGYQFNRQFKLEGGYIHQMVQLGRLVNSKNVFQNNQGIIINAHVNLGRKK